MTDEKKPDPIDDVRKGLGLLFRAAKSAVEQLPKDKFEEAVISGAREVGRAIENVTETIEREVFKKQSPKSDVPAANANVESAPKEAPAADEKTDEAKKSDGDGEPKGPRVA